MRASESNSYRRVVMAYPAGRSVACHEGCDVPPFRPPAPECAACEKQILPAQTEYELQYDVTAPDADPALHRVRQRLSSNLLRIVRANASHCSSWRGLHSTTEAEPGRLAWVTMTQAEVGAALGDEGG